MRKSCLLVFLPVAVALAACAPPAAEDSAEIRARSASWIEALQAGDIETLVGHYTEDARVLAPNEEPGQGPEAVRAAFGAMIDAGLSGELETVSAMSAGDLGYHLGNYTITAGGEVVDRGKFMEIWRQSGGEWKIAADIWNSNAPAGPAGPVAIITHEVTDPGRWVAAWTGPDGRAADFAAHGVASVEAFQGADDPKRVGLLLTFADQEAFMGWLASEEAAAAKKADTVVDKTIRFMTPLP